MIDGPTPLTANVLAIEGVAHGFFNRRGGVSQGLYDSLNCGLGSSDARADVVENRRRVSRVVGAGEGVVTAYQVHGADVAVAETAWAPDALPRADGIVTARPGLAIGVLAADCAPVLFADPGARVVGAAHAGWKGALAGVLGATVTAMEHLGARRERIRAALGPCISPAAYEVGPEFRATFLERGSASARFFIDYPGRPRPHFDLPAFVLAELARLGLAHVAQVAACTYTDESNFFSFRRATHRSEPDYGRQISAICLT
jgi:YfiH family protein